MRQLYFPLHLDSNNRGCEAIARGTINVLQLQRDQYIGLSTNISEDNKIGLNKVLELQERPNIGFVTKGIDKAYRVITSCSAGSMNHHYGLIYNKFLEQMQEEDVCFITGGDMLCYGDNEINYIVDRLHRQKKKVVLWGASIGAENLTKNKKRILPLFDCITARESITYDLLTKDLGLDKVYLFPDPAFSLTPKEVDLPDYFEDSCIGINISNFIHADYLKNPFYSSLINMIRYILRSTSHHIVLIPHVLWDNQDDRRVCEYIRRSVNDDSKVHVIDIKGLNYCEIRYMISKCKFFMGARTHSMISAYSTCVPSIAFGYSVKAKGIAKDIGINDLLVVDYKAVNCEDKLIEAYEYLETKEKQIIDMLHTVIPAYAQKSFQAKKVIDNL